MTTYRTGNHWGVTIVREPSAEATELCDGTGEHPGHAHCAQLVAVVVNGDRALAERICALLNGEVGPCPATVDTGMRTPFVRRCELLAGHEGDHKDGGMRWWEITGGGLL